MTARGMTALSALLLYLRPQGATAAYTDIKATSGAREWVDPKTPGEAFAYTSSRGGNWQLVMSDEFDTPGRTFAPGDDHLWTAIESPNGVNAALEYYSNQLATTECEGGDTVCYLKLEATTTPRTVSVYNPFSTPPAFQNVTLYYQSAMVQSWNKFCFQGGMIEVRAKLPGAVGATSQNPDLANGAVARVNSTAFYPTWPGVWLMGNLGRALFTESTKRMWPFSYNKCEPSVFDPKNQRISACNASPGSGLNPSQGRGAPEIDVFAGGGLDVVSSLQIGPGMPPDFRRFSGESPDCIYGSTCQTPGANTVGIPTETYAARGHKSWYQGLRYAFNPFCAKKETDAGQSVAMVQASLAAGVSNNTCDLKSCPASFDVNSDLSAIIGSSSPANKNWGVNVDGSCFAQMNTYDGALLCGAASADAECASQRRRPADSVQPAEDFKYRVDSVSANWPIHLAMYTDFLAYQVEWVPGQDGYIRWMLERQPIYEIPAAAITTPPQDSEQTNPSKILPEEPMYIIMNVALSSSWSASPPNAGRACEDNRNVNDPKKVGLNELICSQFPMSLKIDYVRVYQDMAPTSTMSVGCDPASHPTRQWINDHIESYEDANNIATRVHGKGYCTTDADCTALGATTTGSCESGRCACKSKWTGPRCVTVRPTDDPSRGSASDLNKATPFGTEALGRLFGFALAGLFVLVLLLYLVRKIRTWCYYRTHTAFDHTIVNHDNLDSTRHSELAGQQSQRRWWLRPANGGTVFEPQLTGYPRNQRDCGLPPIPETPPGAYNNTAASAA